MTGPGLLLPCKDLTAASSSIVRCSSTLTYSDSEQVCYSHRGRSLGLLKHKQNLSSTATKFYQFPVGLILLQDNFQLKVSVPGVHNNKLFHKILMNLADLN